jgi:hypothetical protein
VQVVATGDQLDRPEAILELCGTDGLPDGRVQVRAVPDDGRLKLRPKVVEASDKPAKRR